MLLFKASVRSFLSGKIVSSIAALLAVHCVCILPSSAADFAPHISGITEDPNRGMNVIEISEPGPILYMVQDGNSTLPEVTIEGSMTTGQNGIYELPWEYPDTGLEVLEIKKADGSVLGLVILQLKSEEILSRPPVWVGDAVPLATYAGLSNETPPIENPVACETVESMGVLWSVVPVHSPSLDESLPGSIRVLMRLPSRQVAITKGKRKTFRADQSGTSCSIVKGTSVIQRPREYCAPPILGSVSRVEVMTAKLGVTTAGFGGSATVSWMVLPNKRTSYCDVYRCENGVLVFDHFRKCTRLGTQGWDFSPEMAGGQRVKLLLGYDRQGWKWDDVSTCREFR